MPKKLTKFDVHNAVVLDYITTTEDYNLMQVETRLFTLEVTYSSMRLRRRAYICDGSEVIQVHDEGYSSITDAFIARPKNCKYCVFERPEGGAILVNMLELIQSNNAPHEITAKPGTDVKFPTVDAAMMYALTIE